MARMIPNVPPSDISSRGEFDLWLRLRDDIETRDWIVLHSLDIAKHTRKVCGEVDFLVIVPHLGVLCVEVKACNRLHRNDEGWYYGSDSTPDRRGPFKQASQGMHSLRNYVNENRPDLSNLVFWSAVVLPYVSFTEPSIEWHSWQLIDVLRYRSQPIGRSIKEALMKARKHLESSPEARWFHPTSRAPYPEQCEELAQLLRPKFEFFEHPGARRDRLQSELKTYTEEQLDALESMEMNRRVLFNGAAGTGKTLLAIEAARRGVASNRKVLLLCFNRFLGDWLQRETATLGPSLRTSTLHQYLLDVSETRVPQNNDATFWDTDLPRKALTALLDHDDDRWMFDEIIIDEAQDIFRSDYMDVMDVSLRGGLAAGRWRMFGDVVNQVIYGENRQLAPLIQSFCQERGGQAAAYNLRVNCRNTPRVASWAEVLGKMSPGYSRVLRPDDRIEPQVVSYSTSSEQASMLEHHLSNLYREGYQGNDIVVLSTRAVDSTAASVDKAPWKDRLRPYATSADGHIRHCSIHAFKGLESPVILVTDIDAYDDRTIALLYVATTRALSRLILLVDKRAHKRITAYIMGELI